ncbi:MAG: DUF4401 domain-containing protein [Deltaproteobacteria bacterium]|jgi:uncharacterized membrane protein|nr:DUF4401 domain-containing protein [Deltaproteobacteria bacterium]
MDIATNPRENRRQIFRRLKKLFLEGKLNDEQYSAGLRHFDILPRLSDWRDFFRRIFSLAGILLILAGVIMFLAWNWQDMPKWLKFGIFEAIFAACAVLAVLRWRHWLGQATLLGAAVSMGALLALYGQIYQTGADSWELFRAWSLAILPLFLLSGGSAVGFLLWLTGSLWCFLYLIGPAGIIDGGFLTSPFASRFLLVQLLIWAGLEVARKFTGVDPHRNLARIVGGVFIFLVTIRLMSMILISGSYGFWHHGQEINYLGSLTFYLYLACQFAIFTFYYKKSPDLFFLTLGTFSAAALAAVILIKNIILEAYNFGGTGALLLCGLLIIGICIAGGKLVFYLRKRISKNRGETAPSKGKLSALALRDWLQESAGLSSDAVAGFFTKDLQEQDAVQPWYMKLPMILGIWLGSLLLAAFLFVAVLDGAGTGGLTSAGVLLCLGGGVMFRSQSFALRQCGLAVIFCGLCFAGALLADDTRAGCMLYAIICLALWGFLRILSARTICFAAALCLFYFLIHYNLYDRYSYYPYYYDVPEATGAMAAAINWTGQLLLAAATAFGLFVLGRERRRGGPAASFLESAGAGAFLFALLQALFSIVQLLMELDRHGVFVNPAPGVCGGVLLGALLLVFVAPGGGNLAAQARLKAAFAAGGLVLAGMAWFSPVSVLGILLLILARRRHDNVLTGMAVAYLAVGVTFFYYYLGLTFLQKSLALAVSGAAMLVLALAAQHLLPEKPAPAAEGEV